MTYWNLVSLALVIIGLLTLFIIDRILGMIWRRVLARNSKVHEFVGFKMVDGIRGDRQ